MEISYKQYLFLIFFLCLSLIHFCWSNMVAHVANRTSERVTAVAATMNAFFHSNRENKLNIFIIIIFSYMYISNYLYNIDCIFAYIDHKCTQWLTSFFCHQFDCIFVFVADFEYSKRQFPWWFEHVFVCMRRARA